MVRQALTLVLPCLLSLGACSDIGTQEPSCDPQTIAADCVPQFADPGPQTESLELACLTDVPESVPAFVVADLFVDPGPIVRGQPFAAVVEGVVTIGPELLDLGIMDLGCYTRIQLQETKLTVQVRDGVVGESHHVVLTDEPGEAFCAYDANGKAGPDVGPPVPCSPDNDQSDGSNTDCTGLGGEPDPTNSCGELVELSLSANCGENGTCEQLGKSDQCSTCMFCVTGPLKVPLQAVLQGYRATDEGSVLFGLDESRGDGLPIPVFSDPGGPIAFRSTIIADPPQPVAFECTMGTRPFITPLPDAALVEFEIQQPDPCNCAPGAGL